MVTYQNRLLAPIPRAAGPWPHELLSRMPWAAAPWPPRATAPRPQGPKGGQPTGGQKNFIFGGETGLTWEDLQRQREEIDHEARNMGTPQNFGEGLAAIGRAIGLRRQRQKIDAGQARMKRGFGAMWEHITDHGGIDKMRADKAAQLAGPPFARGAIRQLFMNRAMERLQRQSPEFALQTEGMRLDNAHKRPALNAAPERKMATAADGYLRGLDDGTRIFPDGVKPQGERPIIQGADGKHYDTDTGAPALPDIAAPRHQTLAPAQMAPAGNGQGSVVQVGPDGRHSITQSRPDAPQAPAASTMPAAITRQAGGDGGIKYGPDRQFGTDKSGNPVMWQPGSHGQAVQMAMPGGVTLSREPIKIDTGTEFVFIDPVTRQPVYRIARDIQAAEAAKATGRAQGEALAAAQIELPGYLARSQQSIDIINKMLGASDESRTEEGPDRYRGHPGLDGSVGSIDGYLPPIGNDQADFHRLHDQLSGKILLDGYHQLKEGGQMTGLEDKKAEQAIARLNRVQSETAYKEALIELRDVINAGMARARKAAGLGNKGGSGDLSEWSLEQLKEFVGMPY